MADELSEKLLRYAPQTLAGIKTGSIFNIHDIAVGMLELEIAVLNSKLNPMDIYIERVQSKKGNSLIYVYRKQQLIRDLEDPTARKLLWYKGYPFVGADADTILYGRIEHLKIPVTRMTVNLRNVDISRGYRKAS